MYYVFLCIVKSDGQKQFLDKWESQVKKGILEYIILLFLKKQRYYGYELISDIKRILSFDIAEGTIYPLLNRLKKENLITSEWVQPESGTGIPRKYYFITEDGQKALKAMVSYWGHLAQAIDKLNKDEA